MKNNINILLNEFITKGFQEKKSIIINLVLKIKKRSNLVNEFLENINNFKDKGKTNILDDIYHFILKSINQVEIEGENKKQEKYLKIEEYLKKIKKEEYLNKFDIDIDSELKNI